jgi:hypothetical protein
MEVLRLNIKSKLDRQELLQLEGDRPTQNHFDTVINEPVDAYDAESGRLIFRFRKNVLSHDALALARSVFGNIDTRMRRSYDRKSAAGKLDLELVRKVRPDVVAIEPVGRDKFMGRFVLDSGNQLKNTMSNPVSSYMAGYNYNRYRKLGVPSGFSARFPEDWKRSIPFFNNIGDCFASILPDESKQMSNWCRAHRVMPSFTIGRTCLSTVAINVNYESCYHFDRGDLPDGYSTLTAMSVGGQYQGGQLVLPQYRIAIDIRDGDLLCNQSHLDLHGNTEITQLSAGAKRLSFVTYLKKMLKHATNQVSSSLVVE